MLHRRHSNNNDSKEAELAARAARHSAEKIEAKERAEQEKQAFSQAPGPAVMWGSSGVAGLMNDDDYGAGAEPAASPEAERRANSTGVGKKAGLAVPLNAGMKAPPPKSLGWGPTLPEANANATATGQVEAPYPVNQDPAQAIAFLMESLRAERARADEAEGRLKVALDEKDALQKQLRAAQDKALTAMTGLQVS